MSKTVQFKQPNRVVAANAAAEAWINAKPAAVPQEPTKRLTFNIPESLHRLIKVRCAQEGVQMNDRLCEIVRAAFNEGTHAATPKPSQECPPSEQPR